jgi:hypothetical protein
MSIEFAIKIPNPIKCPMAFEYAYSHIFHTVARVQSIAIQRP